MIDPTILIIIIPLITLVLVSLIFRTINSEHEKDLKNLQKMNEEIDIKLRKEKH